MTPVHPPDGFGSFPRPCFTRTCQNAPHSGGKRSKCEVCAGPCAAGGGACHGLASSAVPGCPGRARVPCPVASPPGPLLAVPTEPHCKAPRCDALRGTLWPPDRRAVFCPSCERNNIKTSFRTVPLCEEKIQLFSKRRGAEGGDKTCPFCRAPPAPASGSSAQLACEAPGRRPGTAVPAASAVSCACFSFHSLPAPCPSGSLGR